MTLIVDALSRAARQCSVTAPSSWLSATEDEHVEIRDDFLLETVEDIQDRIDLPSPIGAQYTIAGDGSETYSMPSQFKRLQRDVMAVYDQSLERPCVPVTDDGSWTHLKETGTTGVYKFYRLTGYEGNYSLSIYSEPSTNIVVSYVTNYWMATSGGTVGSALTDTDDVLLLPRRLVEAGIVWRFRERRGLPFQDKFMEYEVMMSRLSNDSRGRRNINFAEPVANVRWQELVPAVIPSS